MFFRFMLLQNVSVFCSFQLLNSILLYRYPMFWNITDEFQMENQMRYSISPVNGHLDYFQCLTIMNHSILNTLTTACFDYYSFRVSFEIGCVRVFQSCCSFSKVFWLFKVLFISIYILGLVYQFLCKKPAGILIGIALTILSIIDQLGSNRHLKISSLPIHKHVMFVYLFIYSLQC